MWNDPINLMTYVSFVFQKLFGYPREKADRLMMQVHEEGRAVVANGPRETCELHVFRLHEHGLVGHDAARSLMVRLRRQRRIERAGSGRYQIHLPEPEHDLLLSLVQQLRDVLLATTDDPTLRRLFPTAYHEDPDRDQEYHQLVRDELLERRLAALATVETTPSAAELDDAGLTGWLTALNDLRLVLGTRLDVSEDDHDVDPDDPEAPAHAVYHYLGMLLSEAVDALESDLPPPSEPEV